MDVTYECMMRGIEAIKPGARLGDIGAAIQSMPSASATRVVEAFCGHGLGKVFHDAPEHPALRPPRARARTAMPGMIFTVEPMINLGRTDVALLADGWTAVTRDRSLSAQYEHSIGVTETGVEIFTALAHGRCTRPTPPASRDLTQADGGRGEATQKTGTAEGPAKHYHGHRERLRQRILKATARTSTTTSFSNSCSAPSSRASTSSRSPSSCIERFGTASGRRWPRRLSG